MPRSWRPPMHSLKIYCNCIRLCYVDNVASPDRHKTLSFENAPKQTQQQRLLWCHPSKPSLSQRCWRSLDAGSIVVPSKPQWISMCNVLFIALVMFMLKDTLLRFKSPHVWHTCDSIIENIGDVLHDNIVRIRHYFLCWCLSLDIHTCRPRRNDPRWVWT
jgi:hypothetical protein